MIDVEPLAPALPAGLRRDEVDDVEVELARARAHAAMFGGGVDTTRVGRYELLDKLGEGGLGVVYVARDPELDRRVAIKLVRPGRFEGEGARVAQARLVREAQTLAKLAHPNVIRVYDVGVHGERVYITMELVDGDSLRALLRHGALGWRRACEIFVQAGRGLSAAHAAGLVHRDFKPENVLVDRQGRVRVLDFGLARPVGEGAYERTDETSLAALDRSGSATETGGLCGTPAYLAPELLAGQGADPQSDQWSFCAALWEALHGSRPFAGVTMRELASRVIAGQRAPAPRGAEVPGWLRRAIDRGLQTAPADRHPTMDRLVDALAAGLASGRRRTLALAVGATAVAGAAIVAFAPHDRCERAAASIDTVWNAPARERLAEALAGDAAESSEVVRTLVLDRIDHRARAWRATRQETCEQAHEASDPEEELRTHCLVRQRDRLSAVVATLSEGTSVDAAIDAVAALPRVEECNDVARLRATAGLPEDPQLRERVHALQAELDRANAVRSPERVAIARAELEALVAEATELGYAPLRAEALASLAYLENIAGRRSEAGALYEEAALLAEAGGADAAAARYLVTLAGLRTVDVARADECEQLLRRAGALIERIGSPPDMRAGLLVIEGVVRMHVGERQRAAEKARAALEFVARPLAADDLRGASTLEDVGIVLLMAGEYEQAHALLTEVVAALPAMLGDRHPRVAKAMFNLANVEERMGLVDVAIQHLQSAIAIAEIAMPGSNSLRATMYLNLGNAYMRTNRFTEAKQAFETALAVQPADDPNEHLARSGLGSVYYLLGDQQQARHHRELALAVARDRFGDDHPATAYALGLVSDSWLVTGELDAALDGFQRTVAINDRTIGPEHPDGVQPLLGLGRALLARGETTAAIPVLERATTLPFFAPPAPNAEAMLVLAECLRRTGGDPDRIVLLEGQAQLLFTLHGRPAELDELETWLHALPGATVTARARATPADRGPIR